jgi:hypothetical protein
VLFFTVFPWSLGTEKAFPERERLGKKLTGKKGERKKERNDYVLDEPRSVHKTRKQGEKE